MSSKQNLLKIVGASIIPAQAGDWGKGGRWDYENSKSDGYTYRPANGYTGYNGHRDYDDYGYLGGRYEDHRSPRNYTYNGVNNAGAYQQPSRHKSPRELDRDRDRDRDPDR